MRIFVSDGRRRKKYDFGDRRVIGGVIHVRCRIRHDGCYVVNSSGTPAVEWVPEDEVDSRGLFPVRRK